MNNYQKKARNKYLYYAYGELPDKQVLKENKKAINRQTRRLLKRDTQEEYTNDYRR